MHFIIFTIAVTLVIIILMSSRKSGYPNIQSNSMEDLDRYPIAFISRGKLFYRPPGSNVLEVQSPYVQSAIDRVNQSSQLHDWKEGTTFSVSATGALRGDYNENIAFQAISAQFAPAERLIYFLRDESVGGLFSQDLKNGEENRILHRQNLFLEDLAINPDGDKLLCSAHAKNGSEPQCLPAKTIISIV